MPGRGSTIDLYAPLRFDAPTLPSLSSLRSLPSPNTCSSKIVGRVPSIWLSASQLSSAWLNVVSQATIGRNQGFCDRWRKTKPHAECVRKSLQTVLPSLNRRLSR